MEVMRTERRQSKEPSPEVLARHAHQVAVLENEVDRMRQEHDAYRTTSEQACACSHGHVWLSV